MLKNALTLHTRGAQGSKFGYEVAEEELQDKTVPRNQKESEPEELKSFTIVFHSTELLGVLK